MKKILSVLMVAVVLLCSFSICVFAENEETEKTWSTTFDEATGTLTVSGTGTVAGLYPDGRGRPDYHTYFEREEDDYSVKKLIVEEGITSIQVSFSRLNSLTEVVLPSSLTEILGCFTECPSLTSITIPAGVKIWYDSFKYCESLSEINFKGAVYIGGREEFTFNYLPSLTTLTIPSGSFLAGAFSNCKNLKKVTVIGRVEIAKGSPHEDDSYWNTFGYCHEDLVVYVDNEETYRDVYWGCRPDDYGAEFPFKIVNTSETTQVPTTKAPKPEKTTKKPSGEAPGKTQSVNENETTLLDETTTESLVQQTSAEAEKTTQKTTQVNSQNTNEKNGNNKTIIIVSVVSVVVLAGVATVIVIKKKSK